MTPWTITPRLLCLWNSPDERILEWVAIPFSRESSQRRTQTLVFCPAADSLPSEPPEKPHLKSNMSYSYHIPYHILPCPLGNHPLFVEIPLMRNSLTAWDPILLLYSSAMSYFFQSSYCSVYWIFLKTWYKGFQARANYEGFGVFFFGIIYQPFFWPILKTFHFKLVSIHKLSKYYRVLVYSSPNFPRWLLPLLLLSHFSRVWLCATP